MTLKFMFFTYKTSYFPVLGKLRHLMDVSFDIEKRDPQMTKSAFFTMAVSFNSRALYDIVTIEKSLKVMSKKVLEMGDDFVFMRNGINLHLYMQHVISMSSKPPGGQSELARKLL